MDLQQNKSFYDMGFAFIPLMSKSKRPLEADWTSGPRKSWVLLKEQIGDRLNLGVRLGDASKFPDGSYLCVLDCDVKSSDPAHLKEMEAALLSFCPANEFAPRVLSGRGGGSCHVYFRTPAPQVSFKALRSANKVKVYMPSVEASKADAAGLTQKEIDAGYRYRVAWEIDVLGNGKQVVFPPSVHPDTLKEYAWEFVVAEFESFPLIKNFERSRSAVAAKTTKKVDFVEVDLFTTPVNEKTFDLITRGAGMENFPSRSEAFFSCLNNLINAGLDDAQIVSVLTDTSYFMSEKPLEAGQGDRDSAARWVLPQIAKIRAERSGDAYFKDHAIVDDLDEILLSDSEAEAQVEEIVGWETRLQLTKNGDVKNTAYNVYLILKNSSFTGESVFAYDEFIQGNFYRSEPVWGGPLDVGRELTDLDDIKIKTWLSKKWKVEVSENAIANTTLQLGKENAFHPVQRYLKSIQWDGVSRLDSLLLKYCGATGEAEYLSAVGRKFMVAAVARVFHPGVKFDHVLILEGAQGIGKSTFVSTLGGQWTSDTLRDISGKDVIDDMRGRWLIEIGELASLNRAEANDLKAFITRTHDVARKAYGRRSQTYPRQCVFVGTTNDDEYLKDSTGGRRFWPVTCTSFNIPQLQKDREQLWAEALACYQLGEPLYLEDASVREIAEDEQAGRMIVDEIVNQVRSIVSKPEFPREFTFDDVWLAMNGNDFLKRADYQTQLRIKKAFRILGLPKHRLRDEGGQRRFVWSKKIDFVFFKEY